MEKKAIPDANQRDAYDQMHCHDMHRPAERAQTKMGETEAGTHLLFPSAPTSRKPPPVSVFVFGALSAPKPDDDTEKTIRKTERALTDCFRPRGSPNATARVRIKFRRPERAQTKMGETEAGTHVLFPSTSPSRKPPPASVFVFGALSAPKQNDTELNQE